MVYLLSNELNSIKWIVYESLFAKQIDCLQSFVYKQTKCFRNLWREAMNWLQTNDCLKANEFVAKFCLKTNDLFTNKWVVY